MNDLKTVSIFHDGACSNHGGLREHHAGWAAILVYGDQELIATGHCYPANNSVAELRGLLAGLEQIKRPCRVEFYCDSQYVVKGVNLWLKNWEAKNFRHVAHADLWRQISDFNKRYPLSGTWIRGHAKPEEASEYQKMNILCDELAVKEAWKSVRELSGEAHEDQTGN